VAEVVENQPVDVPVTFLGNSVAECFDHDLVSKFSWILKLILF